MNIAMFTDAFFPRINGVAISVDSYADELTKLGHKVCVVCPEYTEAQKQRVSAKHWKQDDEFNYKIIRVSSSSVIFSKEDRAVDLYTKRFIDKTMDEFSPDIIHINSEFMAGYFGAIYARRKKIAYVYTFHTIWEDYFENYVRIFPKRGLRKIGREIVKFHLKRADEIIVPTERIAELSRKYGGKINPDILPTGIPENKIIYSEEKSKAVYSSLFESKPELKNRKILIFVGRIVKEKNLIFLIDVLEKIIEKDKSVALLFVGGGPFLKDLEKISEKRGLGHYVFFTGYVQAEEVVYYYRLGKIFVFPSKTETQGLVTVESMLSGTPVVAIEAMGTIDIMKGNIGGFMVSEDINEFTDKVMELLTDEELWQKKSEEALRRGNEMKISKLTPTLVEYYEKTIAKKKGK